MGLNLFIRRLFNLTFGSLVCWSLHVSYDNVSVKSARKSPL